MIPNYAYITKPFEHIQEKKLVGIGILITLLASGLAFISSTRFDGVIDMHIASEVQWYQPLLDNITNTFCLTLFLYLLALLLPTKVRLIDLFNVALISRIPIYLTLIANIGGLNKETTEYLLTNLSNPLALFDLPVLNLIVLGLTSMLALAALALLGYYIYSGYKLATNAKKVSHLLLLIPAVLAAEIASKLIVYLY